MDFEKGKVSRRGFVAMTGAASLGALLAACGGGGSGGEESATTAAAGGGETAPAETTAPATTAEAAAGPTFDPASEPDGDIVAFEWVGYETPDMWGAYINGEYGQASPLKFEFLENDQQALAKVASGYNPDLIHPCVAYVKDWKAAGLIQPFDTSLLPDYEGIPEAIRAGGVIDGADLPRAVRHRLLDAHLPRRQDPAGRGERVVEHPARHAQHGQDLDLLGRRRDHQDRRPHQRRRAD